MTSIVRAGLAAVVVIAGVQASADAAFARKAKDAAQATTDISECAKVAADKRDQCISRSRPIGAARIYSEKKTVKERAAAVAAKAGVAAAAVAATAKLALAKDGTTDIRSCATVAPEKRDQCISRSRPVSGAKLMAQHKAAKPQATAAAVKAKAGDAAAKAAAAAKSAAAPAATAVAAAATAAAAKMVMAKDGTTDLKSCATVSAAERDQCISRSRPVGGAAVAGSKPSLQQRAAAAAATTAAKAKAAASGAVQNLRNVFGKDGTTDIRDCAKLDAGLRDRCISASRPMKGAALLGNFGKAAVANDPALEAAAKAAAVRAVQAARNVFAKDGTTDIRDCGKVDADQRDRCISASRPVKG